jgi:hypothetical protein
MNLDRVEKKLREARFFLDKMRDQEAKAFGDKEPFDFFLSAFLNAALSAQHGFTKAADVAWRKAWDKDHPAQNRLRKFMQEDRRVEVHGSGSGRGVKTEEIKVSSGDTYSDSSGTLTVSSSFLLGNDPAVIRKPSYSFTIEGAERIATEACEEYLELLERMVAEFKADYP